MGSIGANHIRGTNATMGRNRNRNLNKFSVAYSLAVEMAIAVLLPTLVGWWLDKKTGRTPWFTLGGVILGGAAAIRSAYKALVQLQKDQEQERQQPPEDSNDREK